MVSRVFQALFFFQALSGCGFIIEKLTNTSVGLGTPGVVQDGSWSNQVSTTPLISWDPGTATGAIAYEVAIGKGPGESQILDWTRVDSGLSFQQSGLGLVDGETYYVGVRAIFSSGQTGGAVWSDGFTVDTVPPLAPSLVQDPLFWNPLIESPTITWSVVADAGSPIEAYEVSIGTAPGLADVRNWLEAGNVQTLQISSLSLQNGQTYYSNVRARDLAGNIGALTSSDGWVANPLQVTSLTQAVPEFGYQELTVNLNYAPSAPFSINYAVSAGTATGSADFEPTTGVLNFATGVIQTKNIVPVYSDHSVETNETFDVQFTPVSGVVMPTSNFEVDITDDDVSEISGFTEIFAGSHLSCGRHVSGKMKCWGDVSDGQLGTYDYNTVLTATDVVGLPTNVVKLSMGYASICGLTSAGAVYCWGDNSAGQLGDGTFVSRETPALVIGLGALATDIQVAYDHACAVLATGDVKCWGDNSYGQLSGAIAGAGTETPTTILTNAAKLALGSDFGCAIKTDATLWCWGSNWGGQLGIGSYIDQSTPTQVVSLSNVTQIGAGFYHACATTTLGQTYCWGSNDYGNVGDGTSGSYRNSPVLIPSLANTTQLALGEFHTCALAGGLVKCLGDTGSGQIGELVQNWTQATPLSVSAFPANSVSGLASGAYHSCALKTNGEVFCWGEWGQTGLDYQTHFLTARDLTIRPTSIGLSDNGGCFVENGGVFCQRDRWINQTEPIISIPGLSSGVSVITALWASFCALMTNATVQCWGEGGSGQLGRGSTASSSTIMPVTGLSGVLQLSVGRYHACALASPGGVSCWGWGSDHRLGNGSTSNRTTPFPVTGLASGVSKLASHDDGSCVIMTDSTVRCWGARPGNGTAVASTPVTATGLSGVVDLTEGYGRNCAVLNTGAVKCWSGSSTPTDATEFTNPVKQIVLGQDYECYLSTAGAVFCKGSNSKGQLGDGTKTNRVSFAPVLGLQSSIDRLYNSEFKTCAIATDGRTLCWGQQDGSLPDGSHSWTPKQIRGAL